MRRITTLILLILGALTATGLYGANELQSAQQELIQKTSAYRDELVKLLAIQEDARKSVENKVGKLRNLYADGLISRQSLETSESGLYETDGRIRELKRQITEAEELVAEVRVALEEPRPEAEGSTVIRFAGNSKWSLAVVPQIRIFFTRRFGEELPVSAVGQTALHNKFGLLHTTAIDVALHPDSAEGQALIEYLRNSGTPFIAFRAAVPGSATGAHIHIGPPSLRVHNAL
jgi:hypothetical protein